MRGLRYVVVSDLPEWVVVDTKKDIDLFPTKSGNRNYRVGFCSQETAINIANALNKQDDNYEKGQREALLSMLRHCISSLGYDDLDSKKASWIIEREATINVLRDICKDYGDNNWQSDLYLVDIIDKHLHRHLGYK